MDYQASYNELIMRARDRAVPNGYTEKHHIKPRSLGGSDDDSNLVVLTANEHYLAHYYLYKIHGCWRMAYAWRCMTHCNKSIRNIDELLIAQYAEEYAKSKECCRVDLRSYGYWRQIFTS